MEIELQVHKHLSRRVYNIIGDNINSAFQGLNLAAVHEQEKWHHHFWCNLELREGETFSWWNLTWLSTDVWDDIANGHNKHTSSINGDVILSCDCKNGQV